MAVNTGLKLLGLQKTDISLAAIYLPHHNDTESDTLTHTLFSVLAWRGNLILSETPLMGQLTKEYSSEHFEHELKHLNIIINNEKTLVGFLNYIFHNSINCNNTKYIHIDGNYPKV